MRRALFLAATLLLLCLFIFPEALFSLGRFLMDAARLAVLGK